MVNECRTKVTPGASLLKAFPKDTMALSRGADFFTTSLVIWATQLQVKLTVSINLLALNFDEL